MPFFLSLSLVEAPPNCSCHSKLFIPSISVSKNVNLSVSFNLKICRAEFMVQLKASIDTRQSLQKKDYEYDKKEVLLVRVPH